MLRLMLSTPWRSQHSWPCSCLRLMSTAPPRPTNLTGLEPAAHPHQTLTALYKKCLRSLAKFPDESLYKQYTTQIINGRLEKVKRFKTVEELEKAVDCGLVEELILQAEREADLAEKLLHYRAWEPLVEEAPANQWKWPL